MLSIIQPPEPGSAEELSDFLAVVKQYENRKVPQKLQDMCDKKMHVMMIKYLESFGIHVNQKEAFDTLNKVRPIVDMLKTYFNRARPDAFARECNLDWNDDYLDSAQTPSYPSGHTLQAYYLAGVLGRNFPEHADGLNSIAEMISQSRIDRGVHFPSDIEYAKLLAQEIISLCY